MVPSITDTKGLRVRGDFDDEVPRIRDLELGRRLGYSKPHKIRDLIKRLASDGRLHGFHQIPTVGIRADGRPSKPSNEFWLDERSALKVIAKSETDAADEILDEVIDVFMAYRHGKLLPRLLADAPCEWSEMWTPQVVEALCKLYQRPCNPGHFPAFLASVMRKIYRLVLEPDTYVAMKEAIPEPHYGNNLHQLLTEQARIRFRGELRQVELAALWANSRDEFWAKLERIYLGYPMQLRLMGMAQLSATPSKGGAP